MMQLYSEMDPLQQHYHHHQHNSVDESTKTKAASAATSRSSICSSTGGGGGGELKEQSLQFHNHQRPHHHQLSIPPLPTTETATASCSSSATAATPTTIRANSSKMISKGHYRSSSLENNVFMPGLSMTPFHTNASRTTAAAAAATAGHGGGSSSGQFMMMGSHSHNHQLVQHPQHHHQHHQHHHHNHNHNHHLQQSQEQHNSLGPTVTVPPVVYHTGTLKSKREQRRIQMSQKMASTSLDCNYLQNRINSVDDLRHSHNSSGGSIGNNSTISSYAKSQVRLIRDIFEQHNFNNSTAKLNNRSAGKGNANTGATAGERTTDGLGTVASGDENAQATVPKLHGQQPPNLLPCSGVLEMNKQQLIKPIAFKPIPFPPDSRFNGPGGYDPSERYGSTPSLNPSMVVAQNNYALKFGSTNDLRYNMSHRKSGAPNYLAYDSLESVSKSPDSISTSQSTLKSSNHYQSDLLDTPSPSDSGISELEAALRDRDSELAHLRRTMEQNEKVIFKVHQDKERNWEDDVKRMRVVHSQRIQKFEQMALMQSFQLRQTKKQYQDEMKQLQGRVTELEAEICNQKIAEKEIKEQCSDILEENDLMRRLVNELRGRLEESEWTNCQKNGEAALLKTQLKEAQCELGARDQEIAQLRTELRAINWQDHHLVLKSNEPEEPPIVITTSGCSSSGSGSSQSSSPASVIADEEKFNDHLQMSHLNRIIILKDQIIIAMTNEIQKLRKEISDLVLFDNYDGIPAGRLGRSHGNLTKSNENRQNQQQQSQPQPKVANVGQKKAVKDNVILKDYQELLNNLKNFDDVTKCSAKQKLTVDELRGAFLNNQLQMSSPGSGPHDHDGDNVRHQQVTITNQLELAAERNNDGKSNQNGLPQKRNNNNIVANGDTVKGVDGKTNGGPSDSAQDQQQELERAFERERQKWSEEKEKVLIYQRQLQESYLRMCKRTESLEEKLQKLSTSNDDVAVALGSAAHTTNTTTPTTAHTTV